MNEKVEEQIGSILSAVEGMKCSVTSRMDYGDKFALGYDTAISAVARKIREKLSTVASCK